MKMTMLGLHKIYHILVQGGTAQCYINDYKVQLVEREDINKGNLGTSNLQVVIQRDSVLWIFHAP